MAADPTAGVRARRPGLELAGRLSAQPRPRLHAARGRGGAVTDDDGCYQFVTIEPGAYPWGNHDNAWRPKHIHFSLFGPCWASRLVTQMYFPGDPLLALDPIFNGVADARARDRLVAALDIERTVPEHALAYRFDIVLRGPRETPREGTP